MKNRRMLRMLSLVLAFLMLASVVGIPAVAAVEEKTYFSESFDEMSAGALATGSTISRIPKYATVVSRTAGNMAVEVPFAGRVSARSDYEGNPDTSILVKNPLIPYTEGSIVLSIDYYLHYVELAKENCGYTYTANREDPTVECQFSKITYGEDSTSVTYISLFILNVRTGKLSNVGTPVENAGAMQQDAWNTVKLIIDPVSGTYSTFLNGEAYATNGYISKGNDAAGITNVTIPNTSLIALKCNKNIGAYNANTDAADMTAVRVDNISIEKYTETVSLTVDGVEHEVIKNTQYPLVKEGYTLDYATVTPKDGTPYVVTAPYVVAAEDMEIECHWLEGVYFGYQSFDRLTVGEPIKNVHGFSAVPPYSTVLSEGTEGNGFVRVPFVGAEASGTSSNWDKSVTVNHSELTNGDSFILEASYRPHFESTTGSNPTVEAQMYNYSFTDPNGIQKTGGVFLNLYVIDLATGIISNCGKVVENAPRMKKDEWNTVKLVFYPRTASFKLYLNGELYSVQEELPCVIFSPTYELFNGGCSDIKIPASQFIVAKCNKKTGSYVSVENADKASYIDVDDVRVYATPKVQITVDGKTHTVGDGQDYELTEKNETLLWADVSRPGEDTVRIYEDRITACEGLVVDTVKIDIHSVENAELRMNGPNGVRFLTEVDRADMEALLVHEEIVDLRIGTLIVPTLSLASLNAFTKESLEGQGIAHLDVAATPGFWYSEGTDTLRFAGSIVYVKEKNYNLALSAVGYVEIELQDGKVYTVYAEDNTTKIVDTTLAGEAKLKMENGALTETEIARIKKFADAYVGDMMSLYRKDLNGLNVLAFGDSLFGGTIGYAQSTQWVNKLGIDCAWNLTNLGIGSMTVSYTKYNNDPDRGNKNSMYDWLFNGKNDFRWNSQATPQGVNPYFKTGNCTDDPSDVELIIFEGGCNDYGTAISAPLGTLDSRDPGTFLGAWNLITERLLEQYPNATIVFLTSWRLGPQTRENDTLTSIEYSESIIDLYEQYYADNSRIALINAGDPAVSGVDMRDATWRNTYSTDSYHLKDTGMTVMADHMLPLLWNIIREKRAMQ